MTLRKITQRAVGRGIIFLKRMKKIMLTQWLAKENINK